MAGANKNHLIGEIKCIKIGVESLVMNVLTLAS